MEIKMKTFIIDINNDLHGIEITVKNGRQFQQCIIGGFYHEFSIMVNSDDLERIKKYAIKNGDDNSSNKGNWYAHCNGYSMGLFVDYTGHVSINSYRPYGRSRPI